MRPPRPGQLQHGVTAALGRLVPLGEGQSRAQPAPAPQTAWERRAAAELARAERDPTLMRKGESRDKGR